jgi:hypothetical protein
MIDSPDVVRHWLLGVKNLNLLPRNEAPFNFQVKVPLTAMDEIPRVDDWLYLANLANPYASLNSALKISSVEVHNDVSYISGDPRFSVVFSSASDNPEFQISLPGFPDEIRLVSIGPETIQRIQASRRARWKTSFSEIPAMVREVALTYAPKSTASESELAEAIEVGLRRNFAENQLVVSGAIPNGQNPHSATALNLSRWLIAREIVEVRGKNAFWVQSVDLDLREVSDSDLNTRSFSTPTVDADRATQAAAKLDRAEARHQFILADCVNYLNSLGISPLLSNSVDLAIKRGGKLRLFEIKSATQENFNSQFEKGLIQASRYKWEFADKFSPVLASLIIESPGQNLEIADEFFEFAEYLNIGLLIWDESKPWPNRISNFDPWS